MKQKYTKCYENNKEYKNENDKLILKCDKYEKQHLYEKQINKTHLKKMNGIYLQKEEKLNKENDKLILKCDKYEKQINETNLQKKEYLKYEKINDEFKLCKKDFNYSCEKNKKYEKENDKLKKELEIFKLKNINITSDINDINSKKRKYENI